MGFHLETGIRIREQVGPGPARCFDMIFRTRKARDPVVVHGLGHLRERNLLQRTLAVIGRRVDREIYLPVAAVPSAEYIGLQVESCNRPCSSSTSAETRLATRLRIRTRLAVTLPTACKEAR